MKSSSLVNETIQMTAITHYSTAIIMYVFVLTVVLVYSYDNDNTLISIDNTLHFYPDSREHVLIEVLFREVTVIIYHCFVLK